MSPYVKLVNVYGAPGAPLQRKNDWIIQSTESTALRPVSSPESIATRSRFRSLCRNLELGLFYEAWQKVSGTREAHETRKVALREDRWIAALAGAIHVLPMSVAISVAILNSFGYYIGEELAGPKGDDDEKLAGLQLAAKLHELTIQASIAAMLLHYIRHEVVLRDGLPFGALFAGHLFKDISFLWSSEFWGAASGAFPDDWSKLKLVVLLVVCSLLGLTAGPASATILKPRMGHWPAGGTDFWIGVPAAELWSAAVIGTEVPASCSSHIADKSCPRGDWQTLAQQYFPYWSHLEKKGVLPETIRIPSSRSIREMYPLIRSSSQQYSQPFTVATTQNSVIADSVAETGRLWSWVVAAAWRSKGQPWRFWSHTEAKFTVSAHQPIVHTRCTNHSLAANDSTGNTAKFYDLTAIDAFRKDGDFPLDMKLDTINANGGDTNVGPQLHWKTVPQPSTNGTALAAIAVIAGTTKTSRMLYVCTVDARIATAEVHGTRNGNKVVASHLKPSSIWMPAGTDATYGGGNSWPVVSIEPQWANFLNPRVENGNSTVFQTLATAAGLRNANSFPGPDAGYLIESILATMIVNGLARRHYKHGIIGGLDNWDFDTELPTCGSWCNQMMPIHGPMGGGGSVYTVDDTAKWNATKLQMNAEAIGYAYSPKGTTTILSIAVLLIYSCIVLVHWVFMIWAKESSSRWHSSSEIAALAMNPRPTEALRNTGAGVETSKIFRQRVRIVSVGEQMELSFKDRPGQETVSLNAWYS